MPFAAFFVAFLLLLCIPRRSRKLAVCLLLGALAGLCAVYTTNARLERTRANYAGRTVLLTAEVERADGRCPHVSGERRVHVLHVLELEVLRMIQIDE